MSCNPLPFIEGLLVLPRLRIQNANAISGQHTWGFPAISAFAGLMTALERKLGQEANLQFYGVGVICHGYQAQTNGDFVQRFNLTRNPIDKDGSTAAIVEEGRIHLDLTLVFGVAGNIVHEDKAARDAMAKQVSQVLDTLRVAGGSILPPQPGRYQPPPELLRLPSEEPDCAAQFRKLRRQWLPGFALVARDQLLQQHHAALREQQPDASLLDAWLDKSRLNHWPETNKDGETVWKHSRQTGEGWIVPLAVGYGALSELHDAGSVANVRDNEVPFRFVESVYSLGQWLSPHRLQGFEQLLWYPSYDPAPGVYRCINHFESTRPTPSEQQGVPA